MEPGWCGWVFGENSPEQVGATQCHGVYAVHGSHPCRLRDSWCPCFGWGVRGHFWYFYKNRHQLLNTVLWLKVALVIVNLNQTQNFLLLFLFCFYSIYFTLHMVEALWWDLFDAQYHGLCPAFVHTRLALLNWKHCDDFCNATSRSLPKFVQLRQWMEWHF